MDDRVAKLFAGHIGVCAVLVNILIDKGIISHEEAADRFRQARGAAAGCSGGIDVARALTAMLSYLEDGQSRTR
jgi:hypothetical protein